MLWCQSKTNIICWIQFWSGTDVFQFEKMVRYWMHSQNVELMFWMFQFLNFKSSISQNFLNCFLAGIGWQRPALMLSWPGCRLLFSILFCYFETHAVIFDNSISTILTAACNRQRVSADFNWYVHKLSMKKNVVKLAYDWFPYFQRNTH